MNMSNETTLLNVLILPRAFRSWRDGTPDENRASSYEDIPRIPDSAFVLGSDYRGTRVTH
jgi:hypothetical protein